MTNDGRDWREWAYLRVDNWPECITWTGPKREYGPYPWGRPSHDGLDDCDKYPHMHPAAGSIGYAYLGDVCPYCGVPLRRDEEVVMWDGTSGEFHEVNPVDDPEPAFHPECMAERRGYRNRSLADFEVVG